jgi:7-carboxy-7-deazaguanine synthase
MVKICEIFGPVIQGEGIEAGTPTIFIRVSGCNLSCSWCDTKYHANGKEMSLIDIRNEIIKKGLNHITISGGEPNLQDDSLYELITNTLAEYNFSLETNGTIFTNAPYNIITVSPKKQKIEESVLKLYAYMKNTYFKFVYENKNDLWWEKVIQKCYIPHSRVYIMPEGATREEQIKKMPEVMEYCSKKGFKFSPRLHVLAYDTKRGV